jgi:hypothetical protein
VTYKARLILKGRVSKPYQKGAALILMAFIIGLGAAAYMLKALNASSLQVEQDEKTYQQLNEAKTALIAWAVTHPNVPGMMPWPDRNTDLDFEGDSAYDGKSDCVTTAFQSSYLLGQLPWRAQSNPCVTPHTGLGSDFRDGQGNRLWYAVSRNLVYDYENAQAPIINPGMINPPHAITPYLRQGGTESYPWLKVLDRNGNLISDRVAAVIIAPGNPIGGQNRSASAPNASEFLDRFQIGAAVFNNRGYATPDEDFVMGDDSRNVSINDPTFVQPYHFNDKLVYITIDELMYALESRVLMETKTALISYYATNNYYPFAAGLGNAANQNQCIQGNLRGLLPVLPPTSHTCTCIAATKTCSCNFGVVSMISFTRNTGTFVADGAVANAPTGACSVQAASTNTCTCNGAGSCKRSDGAIQFSCDACGVCRATVAGTNTFNTSGTFTNTPTGVCTSSPSQSVCPNSADGTFTLGACNANEAVKSLPNAGGLLPAWFMVNEWGKYIVYAVSNDCISSGVCVAITSPPKISVGLNPSVNAVVAASVVDPNNSCNIANYLGSVENTNVTASNGLQDNTYLKTQPKIQLNTDQVVAIP